MSKNQLKQILEQDHIKKDEKLHFQLKSFEIVTDKYGGEPKDWYSGTPTKNEESNKINTEILLLRVRDNRIDKVLVICEYDSSKNKKVISTYKSTLSFKHIIDIEVTSEKIFIYTSSQKHFSFDHLHSVSINNEPFEKFHKVLIRKFDEYCDAEYNHFKQH